MKKSIQLIIMGILFLNVISCSNKEDKIYPNSQLFSRNDCDTQNLTGSTIEFNDLILKPSSLIVLDSILITNNQGTERFFHIFNLNTLNKIGERIVMGQGPDDMLMPSFVHQNDSIKIFDMMTSSLFSYATADFINQENPKPRHKTAFDEKPFWSEIAMMGNQYIGVSYKPDSPCYLFDEKGKKIGAFGQYPTSKFKYSDLEIIDTYRSILTSNLTDRVAVCHFFTDLIDIYDNKGNLIKELHGPDHFTSQFKEFKEENIVGSKPVQETYRDAFYSPYGTKDYLYVLYNGKYLNDPQYKLSANEIFAFDWDGSLKKHFVLDKGISRMVVDENHRKIYGISDDPEYQIIVFSYQ